MEDFIRVFESQRMLLYSAFSLFFRDDLLDFMQRRGVETKSERGGRVFPASDDAGDVVEAFKKYLSENGVKLQTKTKVNAILTANGSVSGVRTDRGNFPCGCVVLATGGFSWPATGSTGDGYRMAEALGHSIVKLRPALVPLVVGEVELAKSMQGVSRKRTV